MVQPGVDINHELWENFREQVKQNNHGKLRGNLSRETEKALKQYMGTDEISKLNQNIESLLENMDKKTKTENKWGEETRRKTQKIHNEVKSLDGWELEKQDIEDVIIRIAGGSQPTLNKYLRCLVSLGYVVPHPSKDTYFDTPQNYINTFEIRYKNESIGDEEFNYALGVFEDYGHDPEDYLSSDYIDDYNQDRGFQ